MKQLLTNAAASFVTGFAFVLGIAICSLIIDVWPESKKPKDDFQPEFIKNPTELKIVSSALLKETPYFTVEGVIKNTGANQWGDVNLVMVVKVGKAEFNKCKGSLLSLLKTNEETGFQIKCEGVVGFNLPENVNYEVQIVSGERWPPFG